MNATATSDMVSGCVSATEGTNGSLVSQAEDNLTENRHETMDIIDQINTSNKQEGKDDSSDDQEKHVDPLVGDESWEEHGCILWDLATSRTHAELMVHDFSDKVFHSLVFITSLIRSNLTCRFKIWFLKLSWPL